MEAVSRFLNCTVILRIYQIIIMMISGFIMPSYFLFLYSSSETAYLFSLLFLFLYFFTYGCDSCSFYNYFLLFITVCNTGNISFVGFVILDERNREIHDILDFAYSFYSYWCLTYNLWICYLNALSSILFWSRFPRLSLQQFLTFISSCKIRYLL